MRLMVSRPCLGVCTIIAALFVVACAGCNSNSSIGEVTGKVTYHGAPLKGATIEFNPVAEGRMSIGHTDESGEYDLQYTLQEKGAAIGSHRVNIRLYNATDGQQVNIPAEYKDLAFEVKPGSNRFDIDIK